MDGAVISLCWSTLWVWLKLLGGFSFKVWWSINDCLVVFCWKTLIFLLTKRPSCWLPLIVMSRFPLFKLHCGICSLIHTHLGLSV